MVERLLHSITLVLRVMRIHQWIKNSFVFAPLLFGGKLFNPADRRLAFLAFLSFSLTASALYALNDWKDRNEDRAHPEKKTRPCAAGLVSGPQIAVIVALLSLGAASLAYWGCGPRVLALEALYALVGVLYSVVLKHIVLVDVFAIALGFVLRVLAGAAAVNVPASPWLLLCTMLLALFLGFSKRKSEIDTLERKGINHRRALGGYSAALISQLNMILCSTTVVTYSVYTASPESVARVGADYLVYTVIFVAYGLFRYLYLLEIERVGGNPTRLLLTDAPLAVCVVVWLLSCMLIVYRTVWLDKVLG